MLSAASEVEDRAPPTSPIRSRIPPLPPDLESDFFRELDLEPDSGLEVVVEVVEAGVGSVKTSDSLDEVSMG